VCILSLTYQSLLVKVHIGFPHFWKNEKPKKWKAMFNLRLGGRGTSRSVPYFQTISDHHSWPGLKLVMGTGRDEIWKIIFHPSCSSREGFCPAVPSFWHSSNLKHCEERDGNTEDSPTQCKHNAIAAPITNWYLESLQHMAS
jgi:hypothetical protein